MNSKVTFSNGINRLFTGVFKMISFEESFDYHYEVNDGKLQYKSHLRPTYGDEDDIDVAKELLSLTTDPLMYVRT